MTKSNTSWKNKPFLLCPAGKDYLWGGNRLNTNFHKNISLSPLAETWECSTHPDGLSTICSGEHNGRFLRDVLRDNPSYYGKYPLPDGELPVLVKLIDARENLSVQVHPDDAYAAEHENGSRGKTEMWYVLDADPDTYLVYGFTHDITEEKLRKNLDQGTILKYLQKVPIQKDDVFYIDAGTVHALGAGALVAEVQENSNVTYRLYDYGRLDKNGLPRTLHIEKALDVINTKSSATPRQPMRLLRYRPGYASEFLCRCKYFQVERLLINTNQNDLPISYATTDQSYEILLCVDGKGKLQFQNGTPQSADEKAYEVLKFRDGDCIFLPASSIAMHLSGKCQLLRITG